MFIKKNVWFAIMDPISEPVFILFYRLNSTNIEIDLKTKLSLNLMQKIHTNIWIRYDTILLPFSMETRLSPHGLFTLYFQFIVYVYLKHFYVFDRVINV